MNRLRILLIGAALITGGSALASAQVYQQDVAYHDHDKDRRDYRDHDGRRSYDSNHDRRFDRDYRFDHDRRYENGYRRGDDRRQHWDGRRWIY